MVFETVHGKTKFYLQICFTDGHRSRQKRHPAAQSRLRSSADGSSACFVTPRARPFIFEFTKTLENHPLRVQSAAALVGISSDIRVCVGGGNCSAPSERAPTAVGIRADL